MTDKTEDTLSGEDKGQQKPNATQSENTPSQTDKSGSSQPQQKGNSEQSIESAVLQELRKLGGRITKLEQTKKGRAAEMTAKRPEFSFEYPEEEDNSQSEKIQLAQERELLNFEKGVTRLLRDRKYIDLLDKDKTLARVMDNNPLSLITEPIDAEDAVYKLQDFLDERLTEITSAGEKRTDEIKVEEQVPENIPANPATTEPKKSDDNIIVGAVDKVADNLSDEITKNPHFLKFHR